MSRNIIPQTDWKSKAEGLAARHGLSLEALENRIITDLVSGVPDKATADMLTALLEGCRALRGVTL